MSDASSESASSVVEAIDPDHGMNATLARVVRGVNGTAAEWVRGLQRNASGVGEAAAAIAQILWALGAIVDGAASGFNVVAERLLDPKFDVRAPRPAKRAPVPTPVTE